MRMLSACRAAMEAENVVRSLLLLLLPMPPSWFFWLCLGFDSAIFMLLFFWAWPMPLACFSSFFGPCPCPPLCFCFLVGLANAPLHLLLFLLLLALPMHPSYVFVVFWPGLCPPTCFWSFLGLAYALCMCFLFFWALPMPSEQNLMKLFPHRKHSLLFPIPPRHLAGDLVDAVLVLVHVVEPTDVFSLCVTTISHGTA